MNILSKRITETGTYCVKLFWAGLILLAVQSGFGQNIPKNLVLKRLDNSEASIQDVLGQDAVILTFWATWCKPCLSELAALQDIEEDWKGKIRVVAVSIDDARTVSKVKSLVNGKKWPYDVLLDQNKELYKALNLTSIPHVLIIRNGKTVWSHSGYSPGNENVIIEKALKSTEK